MYCQIANTFGDFTSSKILFNEFCVQANKACLNIIRFIYYIDIEFAFKSANS